MDHYEQLAEKFESAWYFSESYVPWLVDKAVEHLQLTPEHDMLVDIGGGTANYTIAMHRYAKLKHRSVVVEASAAMCEQARKKHLDHQLRVECKTAEDFFSLPKSAIYDIIQDSDGEGIVPKVMMKEVVHHFGAGARALYARMRKVLPNDSLVLLITRPSRPEFPFFEAAMKTFEQGQPPIEKVVADLVDAGFEVEVVEERFPLELTKERWLTMVRQRFMSNFHQLTDDEMERGVEELRRRFDGQDTIRFHDVLLFVIARPKAIAAGSATSPLVEKTMQTVADERVPSVSAGATQRFTRK